MALTMTRNRTQATLNKLVALVANVHGELAFVEGLLATVPGAQQVHLARRQAALVVARDALYATVRQFDPALRPEDIGALQDWLKPFGRKPTRATVGRYLAHHELR